MRGHYHQPGEHHRCDCGGSAEKAGVYDKNKLFGVTTLDIIRSNTFVAELKGKLPTEVEVPVIGGHSGVTILPLLSQIPGVSFTEQEAAELTKRIQNAGTEVVEAKAGGGSATLSMGQAAARFGLSLVRALQGEKGVVECAYVEGDGQYARFFSQPLLLGKNGVEERKSIGTLSAFEQHSLDAMLDTLKKIFSWVKILLINKLFLPDAGAFAPASLTVNKPRNQVLNLLNSSRLIGY